MDFDGKGIRDPNSVISMIDYTLTQFSHSEKQLYMLIIAEICHHKSIGYHVNFLIA
jgi:hypothetical protein